MKTILIIEKNPEDATLIKNALRDVSCGPFAIVFKTTMCDAEEYLKEHADETDLILMNLRLSDVKRRWEAFERVRQYVFKIPVVIIVGNTSQDYNLAKVLVEKGVEDILNIDSLQQNPGVLDKVIEFAICRHKVNGSLMEKSQQDLAEKDMVISWLSGSYSVQKK